MLKLALPPIPSHFQSCHGQMHQSHKAWQKALPALWATVRACPCWIWLHFGFRRQATTKSHCWCLWCATNVTSELNQWHRIKGLCSSTSEGSTWRRDWHGAVSHWNSKEGFSWHTTVCCEMRQSDSQGMHWWSRCHCWPELAQLLPWSPHRSTFTLLVNNTDQCAWRGTQWSQCWSLVHATARNHWWAQH